MENISLEEKVNGILEPLEEDFFNVLYAFDSNLQVCGYSASIVSSILKEALPDCDVRIGYGIKDKFTNLVHHYWTTVDDGKRKLNVDLTLGQFDSKYKDKMVVSEDLEIGDFDYILDRDKRNTLKEAEVTGDSKYVAIADQRNVLIRQMQHTANFLLDNPETVLVPSLLEENSKRKEYTLKAINELKEVLIDGAKRIRFNYPDTSEEDYYNFCNKTGLLDKLRIADIYAKNFDDTSSLDSDAPPVEKVKTKLHDFFKENDLKGPWYRYY